jgi:pyocin large subunit-like protein
VVAAPITSPIAEAPGFGAAVGFRSRRQLDDHFAKHGAEFDAPSPGEYLRLAQALRDTAVGGAVLETRRADGVVTRFHRATGAFLAFNADGTIRTFFAPNDGEAYFRRQARRRPDP